MNAKLETYHPPEKISSPQESPIGFSWIRGALDFLKKSIAPKEKNTDGMISIAEYKKQEIIKKTGGTEENPYNLERYKE